MCDNDTLNRELARRGLKKSEWAIMYYEEHGQWPEPHENWLLSLSKMFQKDESSLDDIDALTMLESQIASMEDVAKRRRLVAGLNEHYPYGWDAFFPV